MALNDNLVARWLLNEGSGTSAAEQTGNWHGTLTTASWVEDAPRGNVFHNTETCAISTAANTTAITNQFSVAFWVRTKTFPNFNNRVVGQWVTSDGQRSWRVNITSGRNLALQMSSDSIANEIQSTTGGIFTADNWNHFVITFNAGAWAVYKNGEATSQPTDGDFTGQLSASTINLGMHIGVTGIEGGDKYMSDVAIWSRVLTQQERTDVYNNVWGTAALSTQPLYYDATLLANKTNISWSVRYGHGSLIGPEVASGTGGTTNGSGVFVPDGSPDLGAVNDPVTLSLYWEEGSDPAVDRSLIVKTTLVAA